jgi:hypothetical protein
MEPTIFDPPAVELLGTKMGKSKDQRKPFGRAIARISFPPKINPAATPREQSRGQKTGNGPTNRIRPSGVILYLTPGT